jgi:hypothetical protein
VTEFNKYQKHQQAQRIGKNVISLKNNKLFDPPSLFRTDPVLSLQTVEAQFSA